MNEREQLENAIARLEAQRALLGDTAVDAAIDGLRRKLAALPRHCHEYQSAILMKGERKIVTVMFADISGFTRLAEKMDPESARDLANSCFRCLVPVVERYDGIIDKFTGDGLMALFGAPAVHENDPERALRAALDMLDALAEFNLQQDVDLGLHFGVNTGLVIAGGIGTDERQEYSVMGDAVNLAARLEDLSERGEIFVGPDTHRLTAPLFDFEVLEPVRVKGKAEPVQIYRLVGLKSKPGRMRGLEIKGISSPLVGRNDEYTTLKGCVERLIAGQGGIVSIIGEAGVGKSRLMAEIRSLGYAAQQMTWLEGRTFSFGQMISYWPFQEILWQFAGVTEDDPEERAWCKLESRISALFLYQSIEILPYLATLLSLEVRGEYAERVRYLDGEAMGRQIFFASRRFFERVAETRPLALVFEDLHWIDESSALLLEHLFPLVNRVPLLICVLSRPYRQTPFKRLQQVAYQEFPDSYIEIQLASLSPTDSTQLVRNLLKIETLPHHVRDIIVRKAEGNPFFLEEIIRALIDAGAVVYDKATGHWRATVQIDTITIPDSVQGVIMARVDRLDEDIKQTLQSAAVIGRNFLYRVLRTVGELDKQIDQHLVKLQEIQLIREKQRIPELEYIFKHALAQEATYNSILLQLRRELHAKVGQAVEALFADRLDEFYGLLAYHYAQAEAWEMAQDYLLKAGDRAGRVAADAEALAHYQQAMTAYARAFGDTWDPVQRAALERKVGEAFYRRGENQQALEHLHKALAHLGRPLPTSICGVRLGILREIIIQIGHRILPRGVLARAAKPINLAMEEETHRTGVLIGWISVFVRPEYFLFLSLWGLNLAERYGLSYWIAETSGSIGLICDFAGLFWLARSFHNRAVAIVEQTQHLYAMGLVFNDLGVHHLALGEGEKMLEYAQRSAATFHEAGDLQAWATPTYFTAIMLAYRGDLISALGYCQNVIRFGQDSADTQVLCWGLSTQGFVQLRLGHLEESIASLREATNLAEAIPDYAFRISANADLGRCYLRQNRLEQALTTLEAIREIYIGYLGGDTYVSYRNGLAEAYLMAVEKGGIAERADGMKKAHRACREALKQGKAFRPGLPEAMRLRGTYEWLRGRPAAAQKWWRRSLALAEEMGQIYDMGVVHLEMGVRFGSLPVLERAREIFSEVGAEWDLARVEEAIDQWVTRQPEAQGL